MVWPVTPVSDGDCVTRSTITECSAKSHGNRLAAVPRAFTYRASCRDRRVRGCRRRPASGND